MLNFERGIRMEQKELFEKLNGLNVNDKTEKKNGLTYLSWAWAWAEFKRACPDATYEVVKFDGKPYVFDPETGYMVYTTVTAAGVTHEMWLPVMDGANNAMKDKPYKIKTRYKEIDVAAATMFDINKAIMRCLTKNLAMFGLGLYIYAGEDLPETGETATQPAPVCECCGKPFEPYSDGKGRKWTAQQVYEIMKGRSKDGVVRCVNCANKIKKEDS